MDHEGSSRSIQSQSCCLGEGLFVGREQIVSGSRAALVAGGHVFLLSCSKATVTRNCCAAPAMNDVQALTKPEQ